MVMIFTCWDFRTWPGVSDGYSRTKTSKPSLNRAQLVTTNPHEASATAYTSVPDNSASSPIGTSHHICVPGDSWLLPGLLGRLPCRLGWLLLFLSSLTCAT